MDKLAETAGNELIVKYGLAGIVILALFYACYLLYRDGEKKQNDLNISHVDYTKTIIDIHKAHREEMERVNASHDSNIERVTTILTNQIKESNEVGRQDRLNATAAFNKMGDVVNGLQVAIMGLTTMVQQIDRKTNN